MASRGPRPEARTTPILDMWGRHAGSGGDPEETDHLNRAPTRCKTVSVHEECTEMLPQREARTSNDVPGQKRRTRPSVRLMSSVTDSDDGKHQYAYGRTDGSRAHSAHRHQGWHISSGQGLSPRSGVTRLRSDDPEDGVAGAAPPHPPPHPLRARAEPMPRRRKPASRMRPGRQRGRSRAPSTTGNTAAEPPPRSTATGTNR